MSSKTKDSKKKGPKPPPSDDRGEGKSTTTPSRKKKKKRGPKMPAPPRPPSDDDEEDVVEVFGTIAEDPYYKNQNSDNEVGSKTSNESKTIEDPIHTKVFRSAESDDEEDMDNAAAIQPAGAIDMAELMMNIRAAPGAIETDSPEVNLKARRRGRVSASKLDDSDDEFHIPTLGGSPDDSERENTRERERRRNDRDKKESSSSSSSGREKDRDRDRDRDRDQDRDKSRSSRGEGKTDRDSSTSRHSKKSTSSSRNYTSETDNEDQLNAHDRSFQKATRVARSIPDAVVRAVGYHERVIQLMQRDDFDADEQQLQALKTFTKSCERTARIVKGVLKHGGNEMEDQMNRSSGSPTSNRGRNGDNDDDDDDRNNKSRNNNSSNNGYNPKEDAIREESKTDLQELLDDINRFDMAGSGDTGSTSSGKGKGRKKGGRSKRSMAPELLKRVNASGFNIFEFLKEPVREEYGMVQFRIVGDHSDNELFVLFDYGDEPESSNLVMTCDRAKKATSAFGGKKKTFDIRCEERVLGRCERIRKGKILQFNIYSNEASSSSKGGSVFSDPSKNKNKGKKGANGALRRQLGAVE